MKSAVLVTHGLVLALAIGCSQRNDSAPPAASAATPAAPVATTAAAPAVAPPAAPPPAAPANVPKVIGSAEGSIPGTRVEVTELKRTSGGTVTLRFQIVNESTETLPVGSMMAMVDLSGDYAIANVHLIDPVGRKKYFTAKDAQGKCVCSVYAAAKPGGRVNLWAKFAAPPDDVEKLSVVIPPFAPADDVPISR
jgi:hypothetical protein